MLGKLTISKYFISIFLFVGAVMAGATINFAEELKDDRTQTHLSFKGQEATFDLKLGRTVRIVEGNIGEKEIKLLSLTPENVEVSLTGGMYEDWRNEVMLGQDIAFVMGGKEQMGILQLLEVKDDTAKFKIRFGNAPPALEIPDDMPIEIIYSVDKANTKLSFKGKEAIFDLKLGETLDISSKIGTQRVKLLSVAPDRVKVFIRVNNISSELEVEIERGGESSFIIGGEEQGATLYLLEIKDDTAKIKISFWSAPPAPEIPDDMPIEIIYLE